MVTETNFPIQAGLLEQLFDCLGDVVCCVKDCKGRYTRVNHAFVERVRVNDKSEIIGKRAADFFSPRLAQVYEEQDRLVIDTGQPLHDQLELISHADGSFGWYLTNKFPIVEEGGETKGVVGLSQDLKTPSDSDLELANLKVIVDYIRSHLDEPLRTDDLASRVDLSAMQLERRMRRVFRLSTKKFVMKCRLDLASQLLVTTTQSLSDIALACGFSDQSSFTRQFGSAANQTPLAYRKAGHSAR